MPDTPKPYTDEELRDALDTLGSFQECARIESMWPEDGEDIVARLKVTLADRDRKLAVARNALRAADEEISGAREQLTFNFYRDADCQMVLAHQIVADALSEIEQLTTPKD